MTEQCLLFKSNPDKKLKSGFDLAGYYALLAEGGEPTAQSAQFRYVPGDFDKPTALILPGYRGDAIAGPNNIKIAAVLCEAGLSVVSLNYGGFDHYGQDGKMPEFKDSATLQSNIGDVRSTLALLSDRQVVVVPSSFSINVALQEMPEHVSDIVSLCPFPNFVQKRISPLIKNPESTANKIMRRFAFECVRQLEEKGYFIFCVPGQKPLKFTREFIESAEQFDALAENFAALEHKPRLSVIYNDRDSVITEGGVHTQRVPDWVAHMEASGFQVDEIVHEGRGHAFTPEVQDSFAIKVRGIVERGAQRPGAKKTGLADERDNNFILSCP